MKNLGTILAAAFLALVLLLYMCTFQVRFTEVAIKKTWGDPAEDAINDPGLYFKWPSPIQSVVVYDKRLRIMEDKTEETRTVDSKHLLVTTFTVWRIVDPSKFHTNFPAGVEDGKKKLRTTIVTTKHAVIGKHEFIEFVSTDPAKRKLREIEQEIQGAVAADTVAEFGIEIVDFGIKKLGLPESVTTTVFTAMKQNEQKKASRYVAEGEARASDIIATAKAAEDRIRAAAHKKAEAIKAEAQEVVSAYYKEFNSHPELRIFLDKLRTNSEVLRERTTLILTNTEPPWDIFSEEGRQRIPLGGDGSNMIEGADDQPPRRAAPAQSTE
ncbi:MAG: SPFH domain-containing protein [Planctomycetota bacterium]|jgi:membrane protease subunit HflC